MCGTQTCIYVVVLDFDNVKTNESTFLERDEAYDHARAIAGKSRFAGGTVVVQRWINGRADTWDVPLVCYCH
jgi:hypothetical protein